MPIMQLLGRETFVHDDGAGPVLLFVHGFPLDHSMWVHQLAHFRRSHRVIAPDLQGFGRSAGSGADEVTMAQYADDLAALLDALHIDDRIHLCGLSMGGYIAWPFIEKYRNRVWSAILCDTRAAGDSEAAQQTRHETADRVLREGTGFLAEGMVEKLFASGTRAARPDLVAGIQQIIRQASSAGVAAALRGMASRSDVGDRLATLNVPVLTIGGAEDAISPPAEMREFTGKLANGRFVEIRGGGHMAPLEEPDSVNLAIQEFFDELEQVKPPGA